MDTKDLSKSLSEENVGEDLTAKQNAESTEETSTDNDAAAVEQKNEEQTAHQKEDEKPEQTTDSSTQEELPNYSVMEKHELKERLTLLLDEALTAETNKKVKAIKICFYEKQKQEVAAAKDEFLNNGGVEEEFVMEHDKTDAEIKALLHQFKELRQEQHQNIEQEKEENLKKKYQIIEDIKALINREESLNKTFNEFNELQKKWREIGLVPQSEVKNMWENYHHHVENFYDYVKINKELRDLDFRKNMDAKIKLCERAEELTEHKSILQAFKILQELHERWREIGPVPREEREPLWMRFKGASTVINQKHQKYYDDIRTEQKENLKQKELLCEKIEKIVEQEITSHKMWNSTSKEILDLQKEWRTIGFAPPKDNNKIYKRFRTTCDIYFNRKRDFYLEMKAEFEENTKKREELCEIAESLQNSEDWKSTTQKLINIQKEWKKIGPVPRKLSDKLWNRFRSACDNFFNRKSEYFGNANSIQAENLKLKEELINRIKSQPIAENNDENIKAIRAFQKEWSGIGHVPFKKKDSIQDAYRKAIDSLYDKMNMDIDNKEIQKFKDKINTLLATNNSEDKIIVERNKIINKIRQLESDIALWENNIGFFSLSSSKNSKVLDDIKRKIKKGKQNLHLLTEKLKVIDGLVS